MVFALEISGSTKNFFIKNFTPEDMKELAGYVIAIACAKAIAVAQASDARRSKKKSRPLRLAQGGTQSHSFSGFNPNTDHLSRYTIRPDTPGSSRKD